MKVVFAFASNSVGELTVCVSGSELGVAPVKTGLLRVRSINLF